LVAGSWIDLINRPKKPTREQSQSMGRTALVIRSWDTYNYTSRDLVSIRSMIAETSLGSGGQYKTFLLVHVKDKEKKIFDSPEIYLSLLEEVAPPELHNITVLFNTALLEKWYKNVTVTTPEFQMYQALQLFSQAYDEFDNYWEIEMDVRYTGNTLEYMESLSTFARNEPRKQAWERSSYFYFEKVHGTYQEFMSSVNNSVAGAGQWGPHRLPDIEPAGPTPPSVRPEDDDFTWGVGEDADVIVTHPCANGELEEDWVYRDWIGGFLNKTATPRLVCPPAVARASWNLLNAIHYSQKTKGLRVPTEATLASFALWNGFKLSHPPQVWWQNPQRDVIEMDEFFNGGPPRPGRSRAHGDGVYKQGGKDHITMTASFWWSSAFPRVIFSAWMGESEDKELPYLLREHEGQVWAPNMALHPVKTNRNPKA